MLKLLFIDQDTDDLTIVKELLEKESFKIRTIYHPSLVSDLSSISIDIPDVIIMNFRLPFIWSWELIREIKNHPLLYKAIIIVLSVIDPTLIENSSLLSQADAIILKPYTYAEFPDFVKNLQAVIMNSISN